MTAPLTVAIPFYRGQEYLRLAIQSALSQTVSPARIHISDDCGPEPGTRELVQSFGDTRLTYQRTESNLGMAGNWNRCLDAADTELVTLLHADDELRPGYCEAMSQHATEHPTAAAVFCRAEIIGVNGRPVRSFVDAVKGVIAPAAATGTATIGGREALRALCAGNFLMCPTACYRKSALATRRFDPRWRFVLDLDYFTQLLLDGETFVLSPTAHYAYRRHAESATEQLTASMERFDEEFTFYRRLASRLRRRGWVREARRAEAAVTVRLHLLYRAGWDLVRGRVGSFTRRAVFAITR
jgi:glycosyltransferase involved in cell wall biosynthesis